MSEYIDYPHALQIDASFGAEYDPYPGSRIPRPHPAARPAPSWISTGNAQLAPPASTPKVTPTNAHATSPIPNVHRLTANVDPEQQYTRTPGRSPNSVVHSPTMPGASRFREIDQPEPTRWTSPTNVSFPASRRPSWLTNSMQPVAMRTGDGASIFAPLQASTPTPTRYGEPRSFGEPPSPYGQNPYQPSGRYGAVADEDNSREQQRSYGDQSFGPPQDEHSYDPPREVDELDLEEEMVLRSGSEEDEASEEEFMTIDQSFVEDQPPDDSLVWSMPEPIEQPKGKGKKFVGGFIAGLRNITGFKSKYPSRSQSSPRTAASSLAPDRMHASQYEPRPPPGGRGQSAPVHRPLDLRDGDRTLSTDRTMSSDGPVTPNQSTELPGTIPDLPEDMALPNPFQTNQAHEISAPAVTEPQQVDLQPTADYDAMSEPYEEDLPDQTFSSHINRVGKFLNDLTHLPWISPTSIAVPYQPAESRRARYAKAKPGTSWYSKENHEKLDLLATPTEQRRQMSNRPRANIAQGNAQVRPRRPRAPLSGSPSSTSLEAATALRPTHTLAGVTSAGIILPSPGTSSHGNGQQPMSYNYYYATPQPLYVYPSSVASPQMGGRSGLDGPMAMAMPIPMQMPGNNQGSTAQQAVPVYMLATPAPLVMPRSSGRHRHSSRRSGRRPTGEIQMPIPQPAAPTSPPRSPPPNQSKSPAQRVQSPKSPGVTRTPTISKSPAALSPRPP